MIKKEDFIYEQRNFKPTIERSSTSKKACDALGADPAVFELLKEPQRIIEISIPVKMDDGSIKHLKDTDQLITMLWDLSKEESVSIKM